MGAAPRCPGWHLRPGSLAFLKAVGREAQEGTLASKAPVEPSDTRQCHPRPASLLPTREQTSRWLNKPSPSQPIQDPSASFHSRMLSKHVSRDRRARELTRFIPLQFKTCSSTSGDAITAKRG